MGRVREERKKKIEKRKSQKKKHQSARNLEVSRNTVFPLFCGSGGFEGRLAKAAGAEPPRQIQMRNQNASRCRAKQVLSQILKAPHCRTSFGSWDPEKIHDVVVRSTFRSQKWRLDHFWMRCRKSAHCCGAKHVSKSKVLLKRTTFRCWDVTRVHALVAPSTFEIKSVEKY